MILNQFSLIKMITTTALRPVTLFDTDALTAEAV